MTFLTRQNSNVAIALNQRAGTHAMRDAMGKHIEITNEQALAYPQRVLFLRNPIERLKSSYSHMRDLLERGAYYQGESVNPARSPEFAVTWYRFIDFILDNQDSHWSPQTESFYVNGEFAPNRVHRFESVTARWPDYQPNAIGGGHSFARPVDIDLIYRKTEVDALFASDTVLWDNSN